MDSTDVLAPGARVVLTDDAETTALVLADAPDAELVDGADAARCALEARLATLPTADPHATALRRLLGDDTPARAEADAHLLSRADAVTAAARRLDAALWAAAEVTTALDGRVAVAADAAEHMMLTPPDGEIERLAAAFADATGRIDAARARLADAAEPPLPPALLVGIGGVHPGVIREVAAAAIEAETRSRAAAAAVRDHVELDPARVIAARDAVDAATTLGVAASRAHSCALGALAAAAGLLLVIHGGRFNPTFDGVPLYLLAATARPRFQLRRAARAATQRAVDHLAALELDDSDALTDFEQASIERRTAERVARAAETAAAASRDQWRALAGTARPEDAERLIIEAALAAKTLALRPIRAADRAEAAEHAAAAEADAARAERAMQNWATRLGARWTGPTALAAAVAQRAAAADLARRSMTWHTARREADDAAAAMAATGFSDSAAALEALARAEERAGWRARLVELADQPVAVEANAVRPLVIHGAGADPTVFAALAHIGAPFIVAYVTSEPAVAAAARAAGVAVVDGRSSLLAA